MNRQYNNNNYQSRDNLVTCAFYNKIGACRHGEKCSKKHIKPTTSRTLLLSNLYQNPKLKTATTDDAEDELTPKQIQEIFDQFYRDIFVHFATTGEISQLVVCENENNHLNGNVYVRYKSETDASESMKQLNSEWFNGRPVHCELSPVDSFSEANCRAYETDVCSRGEHCNYMHVRKPTKKLADDLFKAQEKTRLLKRMQELIPKIKPEKEEHKNEVASLLSNPIAQHAVAEYQEKEPLESTTTSVVSQLFD
ncbi:uncharacterized protein SPAPADRAFT_130696 [Spathaspora passalidarum NRRL Y-27907]|uniref:Uncharacterized protein n=1 Tax=Spathaspora passalidarum (strain NRRL Y-27907 / 11-Y1) TaxID=619300 RepID=G3AFT4_SPAPN|nr:uncharacterized protein SPAPADRAFT_130696 [Spathaspora passalidarum NRRL Y-27907]EGW35073.1 hypothetical protein SPAPADRAFT_130696 [Spathaspora passalidarum NRRL Y-27907]